MSTDYRLHGLHVATDYVDVNKRRQRLAQPQAQLGILVGKSERIVPIDLSYEDLLTLNAQVADALVRSRPASD